MALVTASRRCWVSRFSIVPHKQFRFLTSSTTTKMRPLTVDSLNPSITSVKYEVRGELALKAEAYRVQLIEQSGRGLPFDKVISSNIGNPQQKGLDQPPITFTRQVCTLSLLMIFRVANNAIVDDQIGSSVDGMACIG